MELQSSEAGRAARLPQFVAAVSACLGAVSIGTMIGYTSPAGPQLLRPANSSLPNSLLDNQLRVSETNMAWISSIFSLGSMVGGLVSGSALSVLGRRGTMLASLVPALFGWLIMGFAIHYSMLLIGRILTGICNGLICAAVNTYIGELASSDIRGLLGSGFMVSIYLGIELVYALGAALSWTYLTLACALINVAFAAAMLFQKESPVYLLQKKKNKMAEESLRHFRGCDYGQLEQELQQMVETQATAGAKVHLSDLRDPLLWKPLLISNMLMFFQQLSGATAILYNLENIFKSTGTQLSPTTSSLIVGGLLALGSMASSLMVDRLGRKLLMVVSSALMAVALCGLAFFFYALRHYSELAVDYLQWLPLLSLVVFFVGMAVGIAPVPWILMGEMFTGKYRETASAITTAGCWLSSFVVALFIDYLREALGDDGTFLLFGIICGLATLYCVFLVPETKGRTLEQISAFFAGSTNQLSSKGGEPRSKAGVLLP